jgi:2-polyprenyl-3-methyl-5-hydroxy-6-metoxy-1,4-benzoquinol methylase
MNEVDGVPVAIHTLRAIRTALPGVPRVVIAPAFDGAGVLPACLEAHGEGDVGFLAAHDASPLRRMVDATRHLEPEDFVLRVDALAMFVDPRTVRDMRHAVRRVPADCYKTADDYPAQLAVDLYRVGALRAVLAMRPDDDEYHVHPKFFMAGDAAFRVVHHPRPLYYTAAELAGFRRRAAAIYPLEHGEDGEGAVPAGDQLAFHYERACERIPASATVLDVACGAGSGSARLADHAARVLAGDADRTVIGHACCRHVRSNLEFRTMDACATGLDDDAVDCVTSFETIEHTDAPACLAELDRVLRPGGLLFLSTPQSCHGRVPINPWHRVEFSHEELRALVEPRFEILEFTGLKQGRIALAGDPVGQNSYVVMRSRKRAWDRG